MSLATACLHVLLVLTGSIPPTSALSAKMPPKSRFITNRACPFAQKAWLALESASVPYKLEEISLYGAGGKPDWFVKLNPGGTVPVLVHDDQILPDSDLILDAIERGTIEGAALSMVDASNTKEVKEWRTVINKKLIPVGKRAVLAGSKQKLFQLLDELDAKVSGPFLVGDSVTTADCHAFPFLWRIQQEFGLDDYPALSSWLDQCQQLPGFHKTIQRAWWWWW